MAKIHQMGPMGRRAKSFFFGTKSVVSCIFLVVGLLFSTVTILSIVLQLADWVLNDLLGWEFMQGPILQTLCRYSEKWILYQGNIILHMMKLMDRFREYQLSNPSVSRNWLEFLLYAIKVFGLIWLEMMAVVGTIMVVFRFGTILRYAGRQLNRTGSGLEGGLKGENKALRLLKKLPNDTHVFANLEFEKRGHHETDFIVVAPAGVTVCEVKYWSGQVIYEDYHDVIRVKKNGDVERMHSPVHQVVAHYETLRDALRDQGINANPRGMVLMMHPDVILEGFEGSRIPVLGQPTIEEVKSCLGNAHLTKRQIDQTVQALKKIAL